METGRRKWQRKPEQLTMHSLQSSETGERTCRLFLWNILYTSSGLLVVSFVQRCETSIIL
jgi:hypothetical protein